MVCSGTLMGHHVRVKFMLFGGFMKRSKEDPEDACFPF